MRTFYLFTSSDNIYFLRSCYSEDKSYWQKIRPLRVTAV